MAVDQRLLGWSVVTVDSRFEIHIRPRADLVKHDLNLGCLCGPKVETYKGWEFVTHHALDGRE